MTDKLDRLIGVLMEAVLIAVVVCAPWGFGCAHPPYEFLLSCGIAAILGLWALRVLVRRELALAVPLGLDPITIGLFGLFAIAAFQIVELSHNQLQILSPATLDWVAATTPSLHEQSISSTDTSISTQGSVWNTGARLSLNPHGSFEFALHMLVLLGLYVALSNLRSSQTVLRRLAVAVTIGTTLLGLYSIAIKISPVDPADVWYFGLAGNGFGPYINKNHYAFYANIALGLAIGLLLERFEYSGRALSFMVHDVRAMFLTAAIVIVTASLILSASRGGLLALVVGLIVFGVARLHQSHSPRLLVALLLVCGTGGGSVDVDWARPN